MFPVAAAELLRDKGHDVVHVAEVGLGATGDALMADAARAEQRGIVAENVVDFAGERDVVLVFVLKRHLPSGGAQAAALARRLHRWLLDSPDPYLGAHWPRHDSSVG
jgi:hypothetical protein